MAFLMANQALATAGKLVYDPFVGTGSILVAAAHFGAMTMVCASDSTVNLSAPMGRVLSQLFIHRKVCIYISVSMFADTEFQGADIDIRVVRDGRGPECNVWSNFKQVD